MARKSRKENIQKISVEIKNVETIFSCGIYGRLSLVNSGKQDDGDSIENQISICTYFIKEHPELKLKETYIDNGRKGTNFDRPEFNRMMDDVRSGKINCIIVKDLSRFGRDYLEAGEYIEKIFPFLHVRFIAVTDGFDSFHSSVDEQTLTVPIKNIISEMYAKDLSQKICTSIHARMEKGEFLPGRLCYGYLRSEENPFRMIPDPVTAPVVRLMYELRLSGMSYGEIRKHLDEIHAVTPAQRKAQIENSISGNRISERWYSSSVSHCLKNTVYLGHTVYGKAPKALYKGIRKARKAPSEEWIVIENTHEPLVSQEMFDAVQKINVQTAEEHNSRKKGTKPYDNIFRGILFCGDCGSYMGHEWGSLKKKRVGVFRCGRYRTNDRKICSIHTVKEDMVKKAVLDQIRIQTELLREQGICAAEKQKTDLESGIKAKLTELERQRTRTADMRAGLYENYCDGILSETEYMEMKAVYSGRLEAIGKQIDETAKRQQILERSFTNLRGTANLLASYSGKQELDREMLHKLVEKILVYEDRSIEITFSFCDTFVQWQEAERQVNEDV